MSRKQKFFAWLPVALASSSLALLTIDNVIELPFHDKARDVVSFGSGSNIDTAYDAQGHVVTNWQQNNPLDDVIKFALVAIAILALWKLLSTFIKQWWAKALIIAIVLPATAWIYVFATW